ncbi:regucalcin-like [Littorina saxatilis]|uniref:Regucalcin n=1 Tax=Littorina saxatilis TaxID=31220 RepID=A0AAN9AL78_9CAEN
MTTSNPQVVTVLKNVCQKLGEGPHWDISTQSLYFVDIDGQRVHRYNAATGQHDSKLLDDQVSLVVPRKSGGFVVGLGHTLSQLDWSTGTASVIQEVEHDQHSRFNDGKCDAKGRLWAGTLTSEPGQDFTQGGGALYTLDLDRTVRTQLTGLTISNGLAWTDDNATFFFVDSRPGNVYAFDFDLQAGTIDSERTVKQVGGDNAVVAGAVPDGMTIDTDNKLWVALYGGGAVIRLDPHTGTVLQKVDLPASKTSSVSWGGTNLDELYVTTGYSASEPLSGSLFKITGLGARGRPANVFEG